MTRLQYTTEMTVSTTNIQPIQQALTALSTAHDNSGVRVEAGTFRWRDDELWVQITLALDTKRPVVGRDALAQTAVDAGLATDVQKAYDEIHEVEV